VIAYSLPALIEMHVYYYDDGLRWLIKDDKHDYIIMMLIYFTVMIVYLNDDGLRWSIKDDKHDYIIMMLIYFTVMIVYLNVLALGCIFIIVY
jgi:hypothetical protein